MTKGSKTRQPAPEIHAPDAHDQSAEKGPQMNPAGLTNAATENLTSDQAATPPVNGTTFLKALAKGNPALTGGRAFDLTWSLGLVSSRFGQECSIAVVCERLSNDSAEHECKCSP
jgi:hypothetical protein